MRRKTTRFGKTTSSLKVASTLALSLVLGGGLLVSGVAPAAAQSMKPVADDVVVTAQMEDRLAAWLTTFRRDALSQGISARTFDRAFQGITLDVKVLELNQKQPEFVRPIWGYLGSALSDKRKADGAEQLASNRKLFGELEAKYGVEREVLAAIWGLETHFGSFMGSRNVIRSLTTLAFEGRRADFGRSQLLAALKILQSGDVAFEAMNGSWAGAMGHTQFIPTTYLEHAVDFDGDGKRNIWGSPADALASAANYLKASGWDKGDTPVREVVLPAGFDFSLADRSIKKSGAAWQSLGVQTVSGAELPARERGLEAYMIVPAGHRGPAFLAYPNFRTILRYNNATAYAMAVSYLSGHFAGRAPIKQAWPTDEKPLTVGEAQEMQRTLTAIGFNTGDVDGIIGPMTRKAIRGFQARLGQPQDGFPTASLLEKIRAAAR